jgi:DNA-binding winged helix-turn-helix (wHTH) protein
MACNEDEYRSKARARAQKPLLQGANRSSSATADAALEFGRFRVQLRRRQLLADGVPVELGTRAFDLLLVLLEVDGLLITKQELLGRVWPGLVVSEENLKVQVSALRKALGADRDVIRTEFGRGYRFTGLLCTNNVTDESLSPMRPKQRRGEFCFYKIVGKCPGVTSVRANSPAGRPAKPARRRRRFVRREAIERRP